MELKRLSRKVLAASLALALLAPTALQPVPAYAAAFSDTSGHWAEKYIKTAISKGIVKGYSDGTFQPNNPVTRAEFTAMVNKALGNTGTASISFSDVSSSQWYYADISKAVAASYVSGYADNSFKPNSPITREEAAVIISRIVPSYGSSGNLKAFGDNRSISDWAYTAMQKSNGKGYLGAYDDGKIHPKDRLTRAQTAKIICDITDKETIVDSAPVVKSGGTTLSGKIYSNGVTIHKDLADNNASIDNCIIMGDLSIQGGGSSSVVLSNSRIASCNISKSGSSVRVIAKGETLILNTSVSNSAKLETSNLTEGDYGLGFYKVNTNSSADLTLSGSFPRIEVQGASSNVKLESGTITVLDVSSSGRNSKITVDDKGSVTTANVNGPASFHGKGNIRTMNVNSSGITYENKPSNVNIGSGVTKPEETDAALSIAFDPENGAKNVAVNKKISITFSQAMTKYNGKTISNTEINNLIQFTKDSKSGTEVSYSAAINSSKKVITITPGKNLTTDVKYYITIDRNVFKDENGNGNEAQSVYFTVGTGTVDGIRFEPASGETGVKASVEPSITFDSAIETYSGSDITSKYLKNNIKFRKNSASGTEIGFTASINSKSRDITIVPDSALTAGQKYYLGFDSKVFRTASDDKSISGQSVTWTVGNTAPTISFSPSNGATGVSASTGIFLTFSERILNSSGYVPNNSYISGAITIRDNTTGSNIPYNVSLSDKSNGSVITITPAAPLTSGHNYTVTAAANKFKNSAGSYVPASSITFTVAGTIDITVINTAITRAENARANVIQSETGSDVSNTVYWVTAAQMAALNNAVTAAANAKSTVKSAAEANSAAAALDAVTDKFSGAKKLGLKARVDITVIDNAIADAEALMKDVVISSDGKDVDPATKWVTSENMTYLEQAIATATRARNTVQSAAEAETAANALRAAAAVFKEQRANGSKEVADSGSLSRAVDNAKSLRDSTLISESGTDVDTGKYWVVSGAMDEFHSAIRAAEDVLSSKSASQSEVDRAATALNAASSAFSDARKSGSKTN